MTLYALEDIDDALAATRAFLWPIDRSQWIKLAFVAFFVGGPGANFNFFQWNVPADQGPGPGSMPPISDMGPRIWVIIGAVVLVAVLIGLLFLLIGSIMEFVLIESIRKETVSVREYWGQRWRQGTRLFGFRLVIGLIVFGSVAILAASLLLPVIVETGGMPAPAPGEFSIVALILLIPVFVILGLLVGLINGFTTVFVVPVMILEDCGVLAGWRRLWPTITANPWQYVAYAVLGFILNIAGGIIVAIAAGIIILLLLIPFGILGAIGFILLSTAQPIGVGVLVIVGVLFGISAIIVLAIVQAPVVAYLRYYALLVLGDIDEDLDLVAERRSAIRSSE